MTKKHFIALANYIREAKYRPTVTEFSNSQIKYLADFCESQNPQFNRERWLDYIADKCGPNGGKK